MKRVLFSVLLATALTLAGGVPVALADTSSGDWYYTDGNFEAIHQRADGTGITVAVIDSQINPAVPDLAGANLTVADHAYCWDEEGDALPATSTEDTHGTAMTAMIAGTGQGVGGGTGILGVAPRVEVRYYPVVFGEESDPVDSCGYGYGPGGIDGFAWAFRDALADGADVISLSWAGAFHTDLIAEALARGVIVVAASGNEFVDQVEFPASANGVVAVGSYGPDYLTSDFSTYGPELGVVAPGDEVRTFKNGYSGYRLARGSSFSTAYTSGAIAVAWSAFLDASANQMLQLLVHNTGSAGTTHEPEHDDVSGFGSVNVEAMLADNPLAYPDESPFLTADSEEGPTIAEVEAIRQAHTRTPTATATPVPTPSVSTQPDTSTDAETGSATTVVVVLVAVGAVVIAVVIAVIVLRVRRHRQHTSVTSAGEDHHDRRQ